MVEFLGVDTNIWAISLSLIAFIAAIAKDFILPFIFKPRLTLEGCNDSECIHDAINRRVVEDPLHLLSKENNISSFCFKDGEIKSLVELKEKTRWLRLRLINNGGFFSRTAVNCYVKLIWIRKSNGQSIQPFDPFPLKWVSYGKSKNDLAKGEYHLLDLVFEKDNERILYPVTYGEFGLPSLLLERKSEKLGPDVYTFRIGVYGDNFDPIYKEFKVELTQEFGELRFVN